MAVALKPYDFSDFSDRPGGDAPAEPLDLDTIRADAANQARNDILVREATEQTGLLNSIAKQLEEIVAVERVSRNAKFDEVQTLAAAVTKKICIGVATQKKTQAALELLDRYLNSEQDDQPAVLRIASKATPQMTAFIRRAIGQRGIADIISIEPDDSLDVGEARLEWRGGVMRRDHQTLLKEIGELFGECEPIPSKESNEEGS